jgi:hypothetical protein
MFLPQIASGICRVPIDDRIRLVDIRIGVILVDLGQPSIISSVESRETTHDNDQLEEIITIRLQFELLVMGNLHVFPVRIGRC